MSDTTKGIEFRVNLNTQEANKQIADLQQKLQSISKTQGYSDKAKGLFGDNTQMSKESQKIFQDQQTADSKYLKEKFNSLQRNKDMNQSMLKESISGIKQENEQLERQKKLQQDITTAQKQQVDIMEKAKSLGIDTSGFAGMQQQGGPLAISQRGDGGNMLPPPPGMSTGGVGGQAGNIISQLGGAAVIGTIIKAVSGTANFAVSGVYDYRQEKVRDQAVIAKSLAQASGFNSVLSGRANEIGYFGKERGEAKVDAQEALKGMAGHEAINHATAAAMGALKGGILGSIVPVVGTALGATLGGLGGLASSVSTSSTGAGLKSLIGEGSFAAGKERFQDKAFAQNYAADVEARKAKDPIKTAAYEYFENNRGKMLQAQQMSGMGDQAMFNTLGAGGGLYTEQAKYGMMQGIAGAGGSSAQMRAGKQGLDLQRGYGIQNAAGIMGQLSSGLGGGQTAGDSTTRKILSEAFSIGLDASTFSRETEKFLQISTQFVSDSGARDLAGQERVAAMGSGNLTGTSMKDIEAAGTGREASNANLGAGGTQYEKALEFSKMRGNTKLSKLSENDKSYLVNLNPDEVAANPEVDKIAARSGMTGDELRDQLTGKEGTKSFRSTITPEEEQSRKTVQALQGKYGKNISPEAFTKRIQESGFAEGDPRRNQMESDKYESEQAISKYVTSTSARNAFGLKAGDWRGQESAAYKQLGLGIPSLEGRGMGKQEEGLAVAGDKAEAKSQQMSLELFKPYSDAYTKASKDVLGYSADFVAALITMTAALKGEDKSFAEKWLPGFKAMGSGASQIGVQTQPTKPK